MVHQAKSIDHRIDQHKQRGGHEQRPLHAAKVVPARGALNGCGFLQARVEGLQRGQIENHEKPGLFPHRHQRDAGQRRARVAQPVVRWQAEGASDLLQQPVLRGVEKQPDVGHRNHRQHRGREIRHAHQGAAAQLLVDPQRHQQRQPDRQRNGGPGKPQVVAHGLPEHRVLHHDLVVLRPHPHAGPAAARGRKETVDQRGQRGPVRERDQQHQCRQQQQPGMQGMLADGCARRLFQRPHGVTGSCAAGGRPRAGRPSWTAPGSWCRSGPPGWRR